MPDLREDQHPKLWSVLFSGNAGKRLAALDILSKVDVEWPVSWLALLLADSDPSIANAAYQAIRSRGRSALSLLSVQRLSPQAKVRQSVVRLLGELGNLSDLQEVIPSLFDPVVDIRDEGRKAIEAILARALATKDADRSTQDATEESMRLFASLSSVPQLNVRSIIVTCFLALSVKNKALFWDLFPHMEIRSRNAIEHEILTRPSAQRIALLYHGLVAEDSHVRERAVRILERLLSKDTIEHHVQSLTGLPQGDSTEALKELGQQGLVVTFFEYFPWIRRDLRVPFLRLFHNELGERYRQCLLGLLEEGNPFLVPTLLENFLSFSESLPLESLQSVLESGNPAASRAAVRYLYYRGDQRAVRFLIPLTNLDDPQTVKAAVEAISRISRDFLVDHFGELSDKQRRGMTQTLQRVDEDFVRGLIEILGGLDEEDRVNLTRILSELGGIPSAKDAIQQLMDDSDERIRATAARGLGSIDLEDLTEERIERLLGDPDPRVRANALESLPIEGKMKWRDRVESAAKSESPRERANAILALAEIGVSDYDLHLMEMLCHPDSWMRASGLWVLARVDAPHLMEKALALCSDTVSHVRVHALRALGKKGSEESVRLLTPWLSDPVSEVREAAHKAIESRMGLDYRV